MHAGPEPAGIPKFDVGPDPRLGDFSKANVGDWIHTEEDSGDGTAIHEADREPRPWHLFMMCTCYNQAFATRDYAAPLQFSLVRLRRIPNPHRRRRGSGPDDLGHRRARHEKFDVLVPLGLGPEPLSIDVFPGNQVLPHRLHDFDVGVEASVRIPRLAQTDHLAVEVE